MSSLSLTPRLSRHPSKLKGKSYKDYLSSAEKEEIYQHPGLPFTIQGIRLRNSRFSRPPDANPADYCSDTDSEWEEDYFDTAAQEMRKRKRGRPVIFLVRHPQGIVNDAETCFRQQEEIKDRLYV